MIHDFHTQAQCKMFQLWNPSKMQRFFVGLILNLGYSGFYSCFFYLCLRICWFVLRRKDITVARQYKLQNGPQIKKQGMNDSCFLGASSWDTLQRMQNYESSLNWLFHCCNNDLKAKIKKILCAAIILFGGMAAFSLLIRHWNFIDVSGELGNQANTNQGNEVPFLVSSNMNGLSPFSNCQISARE